MKSSIISSAASSKTPDTASSSYTAGGARYRSEGRDDSSCYFPGCRKDTNCNCKMCLASISATLDLIPTGSSITKLSYSPKRAATPPARLVMEPATPPARPVMEPATPPAFPDHLIPSQSFSLTPPIESKAKSHPQIRGIPGDKGGFWVIVHWKLIVFVGIFLFTAVELGFLKGVEEGFGPRLAKEILEQFVEESGCKAVDLRATLRVLELKIGGVVDGDVLNCSSLEMKQLLDGKLDAISRTGNGSSFNLKRWNAVAMQLVNNTWIVEYKRRAMFEDPKLLPAALDVLRLRSIKMLKLVKQETWRLLTIGSFSYGFYQPEEVNLMHPT